MYIYYQSASTTRHGGILFGLEGSEYKKFDQMGNVHSLNASSGNF